MLRRCCCDPTRPLKTTYTPRSTAPAGIMTLAGGAAQHDVRRDFGYSHLFLGPSKWSTTIQISPKIAQNNGYAVFCMRLVTPKLKALLCEELSYIFALRPYPGVTPLDTAVSPRVGTKQKSLHEPCRAIKHHCAQRLRLRAPTHTVTCVHAAAKQIVCQHYYKCSDQDRRRKNSLPFKISQH